MSITLWIIIYIVGFLLTPYVYAKLDIFENNNVIVASVFWPVFWFFALPYVIWYKTTF